MSYPKAQKRHFALYSQITYTVGSAYDFLHKSISDQKRILYMVFVTMTFLSIYQYIFKIYDTLKSLKFMDLKNIIRTQQKQKIVVTF